MKKSKNFHVTILTIFPEMFPGVLGHSLFGSAMLRGDWSLDVVDIRGFGHGKHNSVDEKPCGGGNGMIMRPDVISRSIDYAISKNPTAKIYYPSPRGVLLSKKVSMEVLSQRDIIILCGRFKGVDERVIEEYRIEEISIGEYILSGGEVASMVILESSLRLSPMVVKNQDTLKEDSFFTRVGDSESLSYSLFTKPNIWRGRRVPDVLLSGNHLAMESWRSDSSDKSLKKYKNNKDE